MKKFYQTVLMVGLAVILIPAGASAAVVSGQPAPDFTLEDTNGNTHSLSDFKGKYVVLEWLNHDCPFVKKHYDSENMQKLQRTYTAKDVVWLSINSSAHGKQGHYHPEEADQLTAQKKASPTAVLMDFEGVVGQMYAAKTTPHMYIIDPEGTLIYQGAIDDVPSADPGDVKTATNYVSQTLDAAMKGQAVAVNATKSYGCSVKY